MQLQQPSKSNKNRLKTLCTIDTSDIDLQDAKQKTLVHIPQSKNKQKQKNQSPNCVKKNNIIYRPSSSPYKSCNKNTSKNFSKNPNLQKSPKQPSKPKPKPHTHTQNHHQTLTATKSKNKFYSHTHAHLQNKMNKTIEKDRDKTRSRIKTQYSTSSDIPMKSLFSKSHNNFKTKLMEPFEELYNFQTFQILEEIRSDRNQKVYYVKKLEKVYIMKKTKDPIIKKQYQNQAQVRTKLKNIKWKNLVKLIKMYSQKNWLYAIYEYTGSCLSWTNPAHEQIIDKILKNQGVILKHVVKQICKGINQLSSRGYVHNDIRLQNICMKIYDLKSTIKLQGNVKLATLYKSFPIKSKPHLLNLPNTIYTPPQIINLKLFESGQKFDRQLIDYISYYDQPWYIDVWMLGVLILELIAGESISIEKARREERFQVSIEVSGSEEEEDSSSRRNQRGSQITLGDIFEAQKSLLIQTQQQIQKISFDKNLQNLLLRMLSINPLNRPNPKQIIKDL